MKHSTERKVLAAVYWGVLVVGIGFMLYSSHADCTSKLAPTHKYCVD